MKRIHYRSIIAIVLSTLLIVSANNVTAYARTLSFGFSDGDPFELPPLIEYNNSNEGKRCGFTENRLSFTVINNNTKVRADASENSEVLYVLNAGTEVIVTCAVENSYNHTWFVLEDGGYVYCKNVAFNLKKNTLTEYYAVQQLKEYFDDPEDLYYRQASLLMALFAEERGQYFYNRVGAYGKNTEYIIVTDRSCITVSPKSLRYICYGYLASRLGFEERNTVTIAALGEAVDQIFENALDSLETLMLDTTINTVFPGMSKWLSVTYNAFSAYRSLKNAKDDIDFVNDCKVSLCVSKQERNLITTGYALGIADR